MIFNGLLGLAMMITVLFCIGDLETVLGTKTGFPFIQVFYDSVGNIAGATAMGAVVVVLTFACAIGITTTASRMTWSFARDRGTPFSKYLSRVNSRTKVPIVAVGAVAGFAALLTLIYVGSATAFNDVISLTITGFYGSYLLPAVFLLWHRIKGQVGSRHTIFSDPSEPRVNEKRGSPQESKDSTPEKPSSHLDPDPTAPIEEVAQAVLAWGPFHIPGILGIINNLYACLYMIFVIFWSVWPPETPVSASTMNYSVLVTGGVIIFSLFWYWLRGRKEYEGPLIDDEVKTIMRMGSVAGI